MEILEIFAVLLILSLPTIIIYLFLKSLWDNMYSEEFCDECGCPLQEWDYYTVCEDCQTHQESKDVHSLP